MKALSLLGLVAASLLGLWGATQYVAWSLGDRVDLGRPLAQVGALRLYAPWAWIQWCPTEQARAPEVFRKASGMTTLGAVAGCLLAAVGATRRRPSRASRAHGSARWATTLELKRAGLLGDEGVVLCQTHDAAYRTRLEGRGLSCTTATRFGQLVRHSGPEHVLCFAPTRSGKGVGLVVPTLLAWTGSVLRTATTSKAPRFASAIMRSKTGRRFAVVASSSNRAATV